MKSVSERASCCQKIVVKGEEEKHVSMIYDDKPIGCELKKIDNPSCPTYFKKHYNSCDFYTITRNSLYPSDKMDLSPDLVKGMKDFTGLTGTFISWHASFETGRNEEMISLMPEHKDYLTYINTHMYDLEVVFKKNYIEGSLCMIAIPILVGATLGWGR